MAKVVGPDLSNPQHIEMIDQLKLAAGRLKAAIEMEPQYLNGGWQARLSWLGSSTTLFYHPSDDPAERARPSYRPWRG